MVTSDESDLAALYKHADKLDAGSKSAIEAAVAKVKSKADGDDAAVFASPADFDAFETTTAQEAALQGGLGLVVEEDVRLHVESKNLCGRGITQHR